MKESLIFLTIFLFASVNAQIKLPPNKRIFGSGGSSSSSSSGFGSTQGGRLSNSHGGGLHSHQGAVHAHGFTEHIVPGRGTGSAFGGNSGLATSSGSFGGVHNQGRPRPSHSSVNRPRPGQGSFSRPRPSHGSLNRPRPSHGSFNRPRPGHNSGNIPHSGGFNRPRPHHPSGGFIDEVPSTSCRRWCKNTKGQLLCCEKNNQPDRHIEVHHGDCPELRPHCPGDEDKRLGPLTCSHDGSCASTDKCCQDACVTFPVCKKAVFFDDYDHGGPHNSGSQSHSDQGSFFNGQAISQFVRKKKPQ